MGRHTSSLTAFRLQQHGVRFGNRYHPQFIRIQWRGYLNKLQVERVQGFHEFSPVVWIIAGGVQTSMVEAGRISLRFAPVQPRLNAVAASAHFRWWQLIRSPWLAASTAGGSTAAGQKVGHLR